MTRVGVIGMGTYLPSQQITNADVARSANVSEDWVLRATGIRTRYAAAEREAASDLGLQALKSALAAAGIDSDQLDLIIVATSTPDEMGPATACRIQERVKAQSAVSYDMNAACTGWLFAVNTVRGWFAVHPGAKYAAVITVDTYTKFLNMADRATAALFSDGAVATILTPSPDGGFEDIRLKSDGTIADSILIAAGGSRMPVTSDSGRIQQIHMDGRVIRDFAYEVFSPTIQEILRGNGLSLDDIDLVVAHQPNPVLLKRLAKQAGIPSDKLIITGDGVGNIGCACTPYALAVAASQKRIKDGSLLLVVAFGAGMTWGGALLRWTGAPVVRCTG
jgi:3-oxoacyl-(acyl-carrier-protein) synthase III